MLSNGYPTVMKALTWHGHHDIRCEEVPDPAIEQPGDAIIRVTTSAICGSDLHLYTVLGPLIEEGMIMGHEPMGIVEEVGTDTGDLAVGDRVVIPFQVACGARWMCEQGLQARRPTRSSRRSRTGT